MAVARRHVGDQPFAVLLGDDIIVEQSPVLERMLDAYQRLGRSVVALKEFPIEQSYGTAVQLAQIYAGKNDLAKASEYAAKVLTAFGDKTPPGVAESAWNTSRASLYSILGANEYTKKDCAKATENYERVVKIDPKNDVAHYQIGMCKWKSQDLDGAMASLARAVVLGKTMSKKAQDYLEQIYKPRHNNTLDGLDELKAKAKSEVGLS